MTDTKRGDVHEALDDVRAHNETLEEEIRTKMDLCNKLKKAQDDLLTKFQEVKIHSEKQAQELSAKSEELSTISQLHQDLRSSFRERESSLKHLNSAMEKLRHEFGEKIQKLEGENKELILSLDESTTTSQSLKSKLDSSNMEIQDLKRIILLKDKKLVEVSDKARTTKDLIQRDEVISKLEKKHRDVLDQLKWKNEQFHHLEEAHKKLQDNFKTSKAEWEKEKSSLLEEISSVQTNLESQTRISENLQTQLRICNQALAHEQSNKKLLEVEVSEYRSRFEDIYSECHEAKATIEKLSHKRDEEVAELRDTLAAKDSMVNEMGYKMAHLELENKDLIASLKELQEAQISNCGNTGSLKKLQKKYQGLEQVHKKCGQNLKEKEVEWKSELEKVRKEMDGYLSELKVQSERVKQLQEELESRHCMSEVQNEEMSSVVLVLKSQFSETYTKLELQNKENEETILNLKEQLEMKNNALSEVNLNLAKKSEEVSSLMENVKSFNEMKQHQLLMEEQIRVLESCRNQDDKNDSEALSQKYVELEKQKLFVESQNMQLETTLEACKIENQILLSKTNELNIKIVELQQQHVLLETLVTERKEMIKAQKNLLVVSEQEKTSLLHVIEEKNQRIEELVEESKALEKEMINALMIVEEKQIEIDVMHQALHNLENEVSDLYEKIKVKDGSLLQSSQQVEELEALLKINKLETDNLKEQFGELVKEMTNALVISEEKQIEIDVKQEAFHKLGNEVSDLCEKLRIKEEYLLQSSQHAEELESLLKVNKSETENLKEEFGDEIMRLENLVKKLEVKNRALREDNEKLLLHRVDLLIQMGTTSKQMEEYSNQDVELMGMLEKVLHKSEAKEGVVKLPFSPLQKGNDETVGSRLPLVDLNK